MATGAGKNFLLKIGDGGGTEVFTTVGGLRDTQVQIQASEIDKTNMGSGEWTELMDGAGIRSMSVTGSGVFTNSAAENQMRTDMMNQTLRDFQMIDTDTGKKYQGTFKIKSFQEQGTYNGTKNWSVSLSSSGAVTFS